MKRLDDLRKQEEEQHQQLRMNNNKTKNESNTMNDVGKGSKSANDIKRKNKRKVDQLRQERSQLVIWRSPILTLYYFLSEIPCAISDAKNRY